MPIFGSARRLRRSNPSRRVFTGQTHPQKIRPKATATTTGSAAPARRASQAPGVRITVSAATTGSRIGNPNTENDPKLPTQSIERTAGSARRPTVTENKW